MVTKRPSSSSEGTTDGSLPKKVRRTTRLSEGLVQLGSPPAKCELKLFPLATHSLRIARLIESVGDDDSKDSPLIIDLPDCPGDAVIFRIVEDFSYGVMDETDVSVSNVVKLMVTSNFLEMEGLASRALKFLEESVFSTWETCLSVLATFGDGDGSQFGEGTLFDKCKMAFLRKIALDRKNQADMSTVSCNVQCLVRVAKLLSPRVAEVIYQTCRWDKFGLFFNTKCKNQILLSSHCRGDHTLDRASEVRFYQYSMGENGEFDQFVKALCIALPDGCRRAALVLHLAKSMHFENDANFPSQKIRVSVLLWNFVCALLVEAVELKRMSGFWTTPTEGNVIIKDLDKEIMSLQRLVSDGFGRANHWRSTKHTLFELQEQDLTIVIVKKFNFNTLLSIVRHLRDSGSDNSHILSAASLIDASLRENLKEDSFTVEQALLIYQEFPNDCRPSHAKIYQVFEDLLRRKELSRQEVLDFTKLLDYQKLSDEVVEKLMADLQFDCDPRLRERFTQMQRAHIEDKLRADHECTLKEVRRDLEVEQQKTTCQICFSRPRDALSLPCMHFLYCFDCLQQHHHQSKRCLTCRGSTTGVLKCILSI